MLAALLCGGRTVRARMFIVCLPLRSGREWIESDAPLAIWHMKVCWLEVARSADVGRFSCVGVGDIVSCPRLARGHAGAFGQRSLASTGRRRSSVCDWACPGRSDGIPLRAAPRGLRRRPELILGTPGGPTGVQHLRASCYLARARTPRLILPWRLGAASVRVWESGVVAVTRICRQCLPLPSEQRASTRQQTCLLRWRCGCFANRCV